MQSCVAHQQVSRHKPQTTSRTQKRLYPHPIVSEHARTCDTQRVMKAMEDDRMVHHDTVTITAGKLLVRICPNLGAGIMSFDLNRGDRTAHLMRPAPPGGGAFNDLAAYWLAPWCNRIRGGKFTFLKRSIELACNWPDEGAGPTAIHGEVCRAAFDVTHRGEHTLELEHRHRPITGAWPWRYHTKIRYALRTDSLSTAITITNEDQSAMPVGIGCHPHFLRSLNASEAPDIAVRASVTSMHEAEHLLPTGTLDISTAVDTLSAGQPIGELGVDHCFEGYAGSSKICWPTSSVCVDMRSSPAFSRLHMFTRSPLDANATHFSRPLHFIAVEPVSQAGDAFNRHAQEVALDGECRVLEPGTSLSGSIDYHVHVRQPVETPAHGRSM